MSTLLQTWFYVVVVVVVVGIMCVHVVCVYFGLSVYTFQCVGEIGHVQSIMYTAKVALVVHKPLVNHDFLIVCRMYTCVWFVDYCLGPHWLQASAHYLEFFLGIIDALIKEE